MITWLMTVHCQTFLVLDCCKQRIEILNEDGESKLMYGRGLAQREFSSFSRGIRWEADYFLYPSECPFFFVLSPAMSDRLPTPSALLTFALTIRKMLWHLGRSFIVQTTIYLDFINGLEFIHFES